MEIHKIDNDVSVAGQIQPDEMGALAEHGFRSVICNRPDDEEQGQPSWHSLAAAAQEAGLEARHIPVGGLFTIEDQAQAFATALKTMPKPILAFCRTGNRSSMLYKAVSN